VCRHGCVIRYMLLYVAYMYRFCMLGYMFLPIVTSIFYLCLSICVYVCVFSMFMLVCYPRVCWYIIYVYDCVLSTYIGMADVFMHEVIVCVVIWSCSDDWTLARMML